MLLYIISISLQISGALLLMFFLISTDRKKVIKNFMNKNLIFRDGNTQELDYKHEELRNVFRQAYLNKFSFFYIAIGYVLGIFGVVENTANKFLIALSVMAFTCIFMVTAYGIVLLIMRCSKKVNKRITNDELENIRIEPNMESLSYDEIDNIFNN